MKSPTPSFNDVEQLSALLDGKLSEAEAARLQARLKTEPNLRTVMDDLAQTRGLLRRLPARRAPRNFTLTPKMAGVKPPLPRAVPTLRFATVLATFLLVFSLATNALAPSLRQAAQAPDYGMGGGGGGGAEQPPAAMPAATQAPALDQTPSQTLVLPTMEPTLSAESGTRIAETPTPEPGLKGLAPAGTVPQPASPVAPIPVAWLIGFLVVALASGGLAWLLRSASERSWRAKTK